MRIEVVNRYEGKTCVIGKFKVFSDEGEELLACFALQEDTPGLERGKDLRVPAGEYRLKYHPKSRFEKTLREITGDKSAEMICVYNDLVPPDRCILIHWGNTDKDTQGCILLGESKSGDNESIGGSRAACAKFYKLLAGENIEEIKLIIMDELNGEQR